MAPEHRELLLAELCRLHRWSYAVFWRRHPRLLVMEDSYYEEQIGTVIDKLITRVHMVGEGAIGVSATSGKHQWFDSDTYNMDSSLTSPTHSVDNFERNAEWQHQFLAGIKTVAIISLPSIGVVQCGSAQKICENLEFINQVQHWMRQVQTRTGHYLPGDAHQALKICDQSETFASVISHRDTSVTSNSINSLHDVISKELQANAQSSTVATLSSNLFHLESHSGSIDHHLSSMTVVSSSTDTSRSFNNPFLKVPSVGSISPLHLRNQHQFSSAEAQALLFPNNIWSSSSFSNNSFVSNSNVNTWAKEIATLEQRLLCGMATNSHSSISHINPFRYFCGDETPSHSPSGSQGMIQGSEMLPGFQHSSSLSFSVDGVSTSKSSSKEPHFELPDKFLTFSQDSILEPSAFFQLKGDQIHPCDQPLDQLSDRLSVGKDSHVSVLSEAIQCTLSTDLPSRLVENSVVCVENSLDKGCDWKGSSSDPPTQFLSDNDLFEGMELDLSPRILRQECWDDIILPVDNSSCSKLSTNVSDCISDMDVGSMAVPDKGLFSESSLEQLLEAVVGESANLSSTLTSVPTSVDSAASIELEHQFSTITKVGGPLVCTGKAPLVDLPSLPKCSLGNILQGSSKVLPKSDISAWIDDSCSMNAESAVTNQPKKSEDNAKVARKRARPGESTRPRPKDRQQIQDRVKELREIVPNGAKCSIDSLLDRTIKHMLFLQSVTKYADKLKQTDEPKIIGEESGVVLKDNSDSGGSSGGATWAYEVAGQTMVCPILVEDLNPPGQMLVEMLCEERGFFLEIADIIRGFGLTILKGVMETRNRKIWARFLVEANRDVTRMDIFLSLVQLLQQTSSVQSCDQQQTKAMDSGVPTMFTNYQQSPIPIPISLGDTLQ